MANINVKLDKKAKEVVAKTANIGGGDPVPTKGMYTILIYSNYQAYVSEVRTIVDTQELSTYDDLVNYLLDKGYDNHTHTLVASGLANGGNEVKGLYARDGSGYYLLTAVTYENTDDIYEDDTFSITYLEN